MNLPPSPPWGRGWIASGVFISRGETGEGAETVETDTELFQFELLGVSANGEWHG